MPNPWDAGSARLLASLGFEALATTSAGFAFSVGRRDSFAGLGRDEVLGNAGAIVAACELPVSADLEDGFGAAPEVCAETVRMACGVGLVGGVDRGRDGESGSAHPRLRAGGGAGAGGGGGGARGCRSC